MIKGVHGLFYSSEAAAMRAFLRDKLKLRYSDVGGGCAQATPRGKQR